MKRIVLESPGRFAVQELEPPQPGRGEALVRVGKVGICGSDVHLYRDGHIGEAAPDGPFVMGHECMGTVTEVGPGVERDLVGRRVAVEPSNGCGRCRWCLEGRQNVCPDVAFLGAPPVPGTFQEYIVHPAHLLEALPDAMSDDAGVMMEPMGVALHAVNLAHLRPGMDVVILGTGVIGTCVLALLALYEDVNVVCVDLLPERLERAKAMGAATIRAEPGQIDDVAEAVLAALRGPGAEVVFECAGADETQWNMCEVAAPVGHVLAVGTNPSDRIAFCAGTSRRLGLTVRVARRSLNTLSRCIELARRGLIRPDELVTHSFPASGIAEAFETVHSYADGVLKAVVDMRLW